MIHSLSKEQFNDVTKEVMGIGRRKGVKSIFYINTGIDAQVTYSKLGYDSSNSGGEAG